MQLRLKKIRIKEKYGRVENNLSMKALKSGIIKDMVFPYSNA
jgi:hypothetical protein